MWKQILKRLASEIGEQLYGTEVLEEILGKARAHKAVVPMMFYKIIFLHWSLKVSFSSCYFVVENVIAARQVENKFL